MRNKGRGIFRETGRCGCSTILVECNSASHCLPRAYARASCIQTYAERVYLRLLRVRRRGVHGRLEVYLTLKLLGAPITRGCRERGKCHSLRLMKFTVYSGLVAALGALIFTPLAAMAATPAEKGEEFLKENAKKEGVKTTASGLQYKVIKEGEGKSPKATDTVSVHYRGTLLDGTEFDSSYKRNEPTQFPLNRVIKGWTEGVQLMKEGAKYQFFIPSQLAYGERGTPGGPIGPNETLIFDIELLKVL